MPEILLLNMFGLLLFIPAIILFNRSLRHRSSLILPLIFLVVASIILGWALFLDVAYVIGYRG